MKKTTMDIYKAMFPSLLIYLLVVAAFAQIFEMMGLGTDAFMTPGRTPPCLCRNFTSAAWRRHPSSST